MLYLSKLPMQIDETTGIGQNIKISMIKDGIIGIYPGFESEEKAINMCGKDGYILMGSDKNEI